jgi:hypothetical protein
MMPPTRIEQLNNFQDAVQSPDGLDRLRALQAVEQALPSSQGLMGMPQVQAPMPMVPRQYGGEVGTGGLVEVLDDGTQVFSNTEEGILNRSLHGGMLQGQTQTATAPSSFSGGTNAPGTLASGTSAAPTVLPKTAVDSSFLDPVMQLDNVQQRGGIYNASDIRDAGITLSRPSDAPETIVQNVEQVGSMYRDPRTGKIPYALYNPQPVNTFGQGYDLKDMDYFTANALALSEGADRFIYNDEYAAVDPGLLSNYNYSRFGTKPYSDSMERDKIREATIGSMSVPGMGNVAFIPDSRDKEEARLIAEGFTRDHSGRLTVPGTPRAEKFRQLAAQGINMDNAYTAAQYGFKHGGSLADTAEGLASFGRYGDNILVHMNPEELQGLASLGQITYNPVTGLPEAFSLKGIFKAVRKIAPIALAIAAPYAFGATTALGIGASTALGSFAGNLIAGAKPGDALKQGLLSGLFAGGGAYLGGASSGLGGSAAQGGTSAVTSGASGGAQGGLTINNPAFQSSPLKVALQGPPPNIGNTTARGISQFGSQSSAPAASLAGSVDKMIPQSNLVFKSNVVPKTYSQSIGSANQIGLGNANVASNVARSGQLSPNVTNQITSFGGNQGANLASNVGQGPTSIFAKGGLSKENLSRMGSQIYDDYANPKGIAKLVAMDLGTPDYDVMYANEAREKEQALREAGYTVDTGFDGQTVIRDSSGVTLPRNLTASMILDRALGRAPRTNLVARTDYATAKEGGLISLKHGGEFSGMVPGEGHGMEDNVFMPITEGKKQVGTLAVSPSEYVVDSYTMAALGNGNADAGAKVMDRVVKHVRKKAYGDTEQPNEISGLEALKPMMERV